MKITVMIGPDGLWQNQIMDGGTLVYVNSRFPSYAKAKLDAKARLSELERIAATGG